MYELIIEYTNGSSDILSFKRYEDVRDYYLYKISYSGGRVKRVEVKDYYGSIRAIWDIDWSEESKFAGLYH